MDGNRAYYVLWFSLLVLPAMSILWEHSGENSWRELLRAINSAGSELVINDALAAAVGIVLGCYLMLLLVVYMIGRGRIGARIVFLIVFLCFTPRELLSIIQDSGHSASPFPGILKNGRYCQHHKKRGKYCGAREWMP